MNLLSFACKFQFRLQFWAFWLWTRKSYKRKKAFPDQIPESRFCLNFSFFRNLGNSRKDLCCLRGGKKEKPCDWKCLRTWRIFREGFSVFDSSVCALENFEFALNRNHSNVRKLNYCDFISCHRRNISNDDIFFKLG